MIVTCLGIMKPIVRVGAENIRTTQEFLTAELVAVNYFLQLAFHPNKTFNTVMPR